MQDEVFKIVLLLALPASGKSEVRHLLAEMDPQVLKEQFHIGPTLQLDDFPYVHFMRCVDSALEKRGQPRLFYKADDGRFINDYDWGTLVQLLNQDYHDLLGRKFVATDDAAQYLFDRLDSAGAKCGIKPRLALLADSIAAAIKTDLQAEADKIIDEKQSSYPDSFDGKTIIIEAARGGSQGSLMPLSGAYGYQYSLAQFDPQILQQASILYIWVSPEESRRKNADRANPDDPGSNLFHGVPMAVMLGDYGCDDMMYLCQASERPDTITVPADGVKYYLPIGIFDNRVDKTSFLRADSQNWDKERVAQVTAGIRQATDTMFASRQK